MASCQVGIGKNLDCFWQIKNGRFDSHNVKSALCYSAEFWA